MKEKVYRFRELPPMEWRVVTSCEECGHYCSGNEFCYGDGIAGFCYNTKETDLSKYKFKSLSQDEVDKIPDWCPLQDFKLKCNKTKTGRGTHAKP